MTDAAPTLSALVARARAAWPDFAVDDARFLGYLAARLGDDDGLYVADLYLACACVDQLPRALAIFDERHLTMVPRYLSRLDRSPAFADEVRQQLRERLFVAGGDGEPARLASYSGRGPLATWVRIAAIRLALNLRRSDRDASLAPRDEPMIAGNPELLLLRHRYRDDFNAAFARAVGALSVEQRQLLRLHFLDALSLGRIAALHRVDKSTISRRLQIARDALYVETERDLRARLHLGDGEAGSLMRLLRSQLGDVSVARLLRANDAG